MDHKTKPLSKEEQLAIEMFNAYNESGPNPWKTFDGREVPRWHELNDQVQTKWKAAATAALYRVGIK